MSEDEEVYPCDIKRRKIESMDKNDFIGYELETACKKEFKIWHLPNEIVQEIFEYLSAETLVRSVKNVSRNFDLLVQSSLTIRFTRLETRLYNVLRHVKKMLVTSKFRTMIRSSLRLVHFAEILVQQYKLLESTIWRYLEYESLGYAFCLAGSQILDSFDEIIYKIYENPRHFKLDIRKNSLMEKICSKIKSFISFFEKNIEVRLNTSCFVSGAKLCDILDCATFADKEIIHENVENGVYTMRVKYRLSLAWFSAVELRPIESSERYTWEEKQRVMYMRIRRMAYAHTTMSLEQSHWERIRSKLSGASIFHLQRFRPINSLYAGYGEFGGYLYYYGCLNRGAYEYKLINSENRSDSDALNSKSCYLEIDVDLMCPIECAPMSVYKQNCLNFERKHINIIPPLNKRRVTRKLSGMFHLRLDFSCEFAEINRLPSRYIFDVSEVDRIDMITHDGQ